MSKVMITDTYLTNIANAIRNKNSSTTTYKPSEMATAITNLPSGSVSIPPNTFFAFSQTSNDNFNTFIAALDTSAYTTMNYMFAGLVNITNLDLSNFNTANVKDMSYMFYECTKLQTVNLSNFNTANVVSMSCMFYDCTYLQTVNLSNFNTKKVLNMTCMFYGCPSLTSANLSSFNGHSVYFTSSMFENCDDLQTVNLSSFATPKLTKVNSMFKGCTSLVSIDIRNMNFSLVTAYSNFLPSTVPTTLTTIYVNQSGYDFITAHFSAYTNKLSLIS